MIPFKQNSGKGKTVRLENRSLAATNWWGRGGIDYEAAPKGNVHGAGNFTYGTVVADT